MSISVSGCSEQQTSTPTKVSEPHFVEKRVTDYVWASGSPDYVKDALVECNGMAIHIYEYNTGLEKYK